jgi:hypothetical protein
MPYSTDGKLEWFGGNQDALSMYRMFVDLSHTWDDLVDKDKSVSEDAINNAFLICLVYLPLNPFYQQIQKQVAPLWMMVVSAYQTANQFERDKDPHGIEIAHNLRYAAGHIIAYAVQVCLGPQEAQKVLPDVWKDIVHERFDEYRKGHLNEHN